MGFFKKFIFPPLYGLLVYFTIRLLHDSETMVAFWKRSWWLNSFEMFCSITVGYLSILLFTKLLQYFDKRQAVLRMDYNRVIRELAVFVGLHAILINIVFTPMAAFTDDGLSLGDFVDVNVVPTLFAIIYYGITRSRIFLDAYVDKKTQLERVTNEQLETELKFLKAQYHPHFLFNAINTVYFQMDEDVEGAKKTLEKFSELLRYQLYDQQQLVPVSQEIDYLDNYIAIQKIRSSAQLKLTVEIDPQLKQQHLYPLLLLPLIENGFKYVGGNYLLHICLAWENEKIILSVSNSIPAMVAVREDAAGIGLENLSRRLALLYPGRHSLVVEQKDDLFIAKLELDIADGNF